MTVKTNDPRPPYLQIADDLRDAIRSGRYEQGHRLPAGRELAKQLKARKPDLKVIYTSGYALDLDGTGFILREGLNFLQKPSKAEKILQTVQDLLGE